MALLVGFSLAGAGWSRMAFCVSFLAQRLIYEVLRLVLAPGGLSCFSRPAEVSSDIRLKVLKCKEKKEGMPQCGSAFQLSTCIVLAKGLGGLFVNEHPAKT